MAITRHRSSLVVSKIVRPLSCLFYLLVLLKVKLSLTDPQGALHKYPNYAYDDRNLNDNVGNFNSNTNFGDGLFMVGNSYTSVNNLAGIITNMLEHSSGSSSMSGVKLPLQTKTWSLDGAKWKDYAFQLSSTYHPEPPSTFEDALKGKEFRWVVLQEQSQIPGLYQSNYFQYEWTGSVRAVKLLDSDIQKFGNSDHTTQTILFQSWGRLHRGTLAPQLAEIYDSFLSHQSRIANGLKEYQRQISTPERPVLIAPVGYAFQAIYDSIVKEDQDPYQKGGKFASLYNKDGSHPSAQGSYLAASVLVGILTGQDPRQFDWNYPLVPHNTQECLREVAHTTIANFCQSEYCNPMPIKETAAREDPSVPPSSFLSRHLMRFLLFAGVILLALKKCSVGKNNNGYSSLVQDRGR